MSRNIVASEGKGKWEPLPKWFIALVVAMLAMLVTVTVLGSDNDSVADQSGGIEWTINETEKTLEINVGVGSEGCESGWMLDYGGTEKTEAPWNTISGEGYKVIIGEGVNNIGGNAFLGLTAISDIYVDANIASDLGTDAFKGCTLTVHVHKHSDYSHWGALPAGVSLNYDIIDKP